MVEWVVLNGFSQDFIFPCSRWIREMEGSKLKVLQTGDPSYMRTMERAMRVGEPVLLQVYILTSPWDFSESDS